jgi:hypothetical protein
VNAFDVASDVGGAVAAQGPTNAAVLICLGFALAVVIVVAVAWVIAGHGIRLELHGLRIDLRLFQRGEALEDLEPLTAPRILGPLRQLTPDEPPRAVRRGPAESKPSISQPGGRKRMPSQS